MTFAVIQTGGKQYKVSEGDTITIEKLPGDFKAGDKVTFEEVLVVDDGKDATFGAPFVKGAKVVGEFVTAGRAPKITVIRYKQKSRYFKKNGHRQPFIKVKINSVK
ncbi:50S ribosomal protein L21 [Candidatus Parcubacteria bacterium]|nr:50S ribosomal protein L21 [Candidatus Parcubacteria bacterium]